MNESNGHEQRRKAVAVKYDSETQNAPKVVAKGAGLLADRIIKLAREHGVYVHEDPDLTAILSQLDVDMEIPEELYLAMAEVLAFVYRLNSKI